MSSGSADRRTSLGQERRFRKQQQQQQRSNISAVTNHYRPNYSSDDDDEDDDEEEQLDRHVSDLYGEAQEEPTAASAAVGTSGKKRKSKDDIGVKAKVEKAYDKKKKPRLPRPSVKIGDLTGANGLIRIPKEFAQRLHYGGGNKTAKQHKQQQQQQAAAPKHNVDASATFSRQLMQQYKAFCHDLCMGVAWQDVLLTIETSLGSKKEVKDYIHQMRQDQRNQYLENVLGRERAEILIQELQEEKEQLLHHQAATQEEGQQQQQQQLAEGEDDVAPKDNAAPNGESGNPKVKEKDNGGNDDDDEQEVTFMDGEELTTVPRPRPVTTTATSRNTTSSNNNTVLDDDDDKEEEEDAQEDEEIVHKTSNNARRQQRLRVFEEDFSDDEQEAVFDDNEEEDNDNNNQQHPMETVTDEATTLLQNPKNKLEGDKMSSTRKKTVVDEDSSDDEEEEAEFQDAPCKPTVDKDNNVNQDMDEDIPSENNSNTSNQTESSDNISGENNDKEVEEMDIVRTEEGAHHPANENTFVGNDPSSPPPSKDINKPGGAPNDGNDKTVVHMSHECFNQSSPSPKKTHHGAAAAGGHDDDLGSQVGMHLAQTQLTPTFSQQTDDASLLSQEFMVPRTTTTPRSLVATLQETLDSYHMEEGPHNVDAATAASITTSPISPMSGPSGARVTTQASASMILEDEEKTIIASSASQDTLIPESQFDLSSTQ